DPGPRPDRRGLRDRCPGRGRRERRPARCLQSKRSDRGCPGLEHDPAPEVGALPHRPGARGGRCRGVTVPRSGMGTQPVSVELSRSIKRTLEVLEFFDAEHPAVSVSEISRALGYPQSSTSILLKSLMELGYLHYDKVTRTYRPTARVALLGRNVQSYLFGDGA